VPGGPHGLQNRWDPAEGSGGFDSHSPPPQPGRAVTDRMPWQVARSLAAGAAAPLEAISVPLGEARGAVLATPLRARADLPAFDAAAMDGYAVAGPGPWLVAGRVLAGQTMPGEIGAGQAVEIATGAPVPYGTEAVIPYEWVTRRGTKIDGAFEPGRHVRRRGEDCPEGAKVLPSGAVVTSVVQGLAAGLGHDTLDVLRRPRVAILVTGDELVASGLPGMGRVRDALGPLLPGLVSWAGGSAGAPSRVADRGAALAGAIADAGEADVVVVCGSSSRGAADHLRDVLREAGAVFLVEGVACRPGHPQLLARLADTRLVVGLPGNPYAALVAALTLLIPILSGMAGRSAGRTEWAKLSPEVATHPADTRIVAVRRVGAAAVPVGHDRPGLLWGAALADALAVVPPGWRGEETELLGLPTRL
jgi:molybdopterin molybdotransferase